MRQTPEVLWENMNPSELDAAIARRPLAYVPCGSLEWHGPHLPLGCDFFRGAAICGRAAAISGGVVLPPLYIAAAGYCAYRGSIFFSCRLVKDMVRELIRELRKVGFRAAVLLLAHAGPPQDESFREPAEACGPDCGMRILVTNGASLIPGGLPGGHAGSSETMQCMASRPGSVNLSRFDPRNTKLPRYEGLDPALYCDGLSERWHEDVTAHMARTEYKWQPDLVSLCSMEKGEAQLDAIACALATRALVLLDAVSG